MTGTAESSDEDDDDNEGGHHMKADNSNPISGDDLGDSFSVDKSAKRKKGWVEEIYEKEGRKIGEDVASGDEGSSDGGEDEDEDDDEDAGDEEDSSDNDFGNMPARDWEQSDDDEIAVEEDENDDVKERGQVTEDKLLKTNTHNLKKVSNAKQPPYKDEDLPFVIEAPNNLQDLFSLVDGRSETEIIEIISRIRTCNSIRLTAENRKKLQVCDTN
jgi:nucleolar protein 14